MEDIRRLEDKTKEELDQVTYLIGGELVVLAVIFVIGPSIPQNRETQKVPRMWRGGIKDRKVLVEKYNLVRWKEIKLEIYLISNQNRFIPSCIGPSSRQILCGINDTNSKFVCINFRSYASDYRILLFLKFVTMT